ncbi:MAG: TonB-dependent receptor [Kiritimatiellae bacterium]|jgi:Fe(3+) dicitrate transport protein|nr:TonB-dependent receptor [Kiritimatiellia bacterium]
MKRSILSIYLLLTGLVAATAQETQVLSPLSVVGGKETIQQQVGSAVYLDQDDIRKQNHLNVNQMLNQVPGVYTRDEDGYGNFPNISLRGADGTRSEKVTVMEDGILTSPAPYSAPSAYYFPTASRMSGIEILKGSSQVRYGPHTTGGVINFLSTPVPEEATGFLRYTFGTDQTHQGLVNYGNTGETDGGRFGYLVELLYQSTDGYRDIDKKGGDTGFERTEPMVKLFWEPNGAFPQRIEFKFGQSRFQADETYLGLSESDIQSDPYRRYAATLYDNISTEHIRTYLRYTASPSDTLDLESTLYYNTFHRAWYKLDHVSTDAAPEVDGRGRISDRADLHKALLEGNPALPVLKGDAAGSIGVKNNNRDYEVIGWQNALTKRFAVGEVEHALTGGLRLHYDFVDRFQEVDVYTGDGAGTFPLFRSGPSGEEADRYEETFATAIFLEDAMRMGDLTLKPGVRGEFLQYDIDDAGIKSDGRLNTWAAGLGSSYDLGPADTVFGGVYRGISTPGPNSHVNGGIDPEESISTELGFRHANDVFAYEIAGFYTKYENLIGTDAGLDSGGGSNVNAGEATVWGFEGQINTELVGSEAGFRLPAYFNVTYTRAELDNALASGGGEDIYAGGSSGSTLPYVPEWKLAFGIGYILDAFSVNLDASWVDESFGTANNFFEPNVTSREGEIDDVLLVDLSATLSVREDLRLLAGIQNLTDEDYITSRIPHGPRSGAPRSVYAGFEFDW